MIDEGTARHLLTTVGLSRPVIGGAALLALSDAGEPLAIRRDRNGYSLEGPSAGDPAECWPDAFGVNPYKVGRVALTVGPRSTWAKARARALLAA